jgi:hypothetical protein
VCVEYQIVLTGDFLGVPMARFAMELEGSMSVLQLWLLTVSVEALLCGPAYLLINASLLR